MGRTMVFVGDKPVIDIEHTENSFQRKFKKGDQVRTKCTCSKYERPICKCAEYFKKYKRAYEYCNHCRYCNQVGTVEDTEEAGSNYLGIPLYGLRKPDGEWLGDFLEEEVEPI